MLAVICTQILV